MLRFVSITIISFLACTESIDGSSRLMVQIPSKLYREDGYDHRVARFGVPPYPGSLSQATYYAGSDFCHSEESKDSRWAPPFILVVDRGGCTFVEKVRNAQRVGAAGVIIADNTCLCSDQACIQSNQMTSCETTAPFINGDGSESDISIPSFFMFKLDADAVKSELESGNHHVHMEMTWSIPNPDDRVEYDLWASPVDPIEPELFEWFRKLALKLGRNAYFTPHMYIFDGVRSGCRSRSENVCDGLCTNNGRYCAPNPPGLPAKGSDVVKESLRRACIWRHYGLSDGVGSEWWDYVFNFSIICTGSRFSDEICVLEVMKQSHIASEKIDRCMVDSGGVEMDGPNSFLDLAISNQANNGIVIIPSLTVDGGNPTRGLLTPGNVLSTICDRYLYSSMPDICKQCVRCWDPIECVERGRCPTLDNLTVAAELGPVSISPMVTAANPEPTPEASNMSEESGLSPVVIVVSIAIAFTMFILLVGCGLIWLYRSKKQTTNIRYKSVNIEEDDERDLKYGNGGGE